MSVAYICWHDNNEIDTLNLMIQNMERGCYQTERNLNIITVYLIFERSRMCDSRVGSQTLVSHFDLGKGHFCNIQNKRSKHNSHACIRKVLAIKLLAQINMQ